ncbi:hypothetical protein QTG54_008932 [Skeletonema marinoi]|uniref:MYND-type domain-containing protein n=1 Tax=Skeletonema marinoi TaxID=267567 RepID=A0AAD8Y5Q1_9STRA|nr:hypothetical protein QTG54_008932 [Skeletonema marinoi]
MMSGVSDEDESDNMICCAACGVAENENIRLKKCNACKSVRYCSVQCQKDHMPQHKRACKKLVAELRDEILFKQPESTHLGDCPICCLPLPIDDDKYIMMACCSKMICNGCNYANRMRELEGTAKSQKEAERDLMKRAEANDPVYMSQVGVRCYQEGDYKGAFGYLTKAAGLGDAVAHFQLSCMYYDGKGVQKDKKKEVYHVEQAAIRGHLRARHNLGFIEKAVKHWIIAANMGYDGPLENLKLEYREGLVSKEDYASALRGHQTAVDAAKSSQRDEAEAARIK